MDGDVSPGPAAPDLRVVQFARREPRSVGNGWQMALRIENANLKPEAATGNG